MLDPDTAFLIDSLRTKKFDFQQESQLSTVQLVGNQFHFASSSLMRESNIPNLCAMIHAENVLEIQTKKPTEAKISKLNSKSRIPVGAKAVKKKFEYIGEEEETSGPPEPSSCAASGSELCKKAKTVKKKFVL